MKTETGEETTQCEVTVLGSCDPISVENFAGVPTLSYTRSMPYVCASCWRETEHVNECARAALTISNRMPLSRSLVRNNVGELTARGSLFKSWFHPGEAVAAMLDLENFPSTATSGGTLTCVAATLLQHQRFRSCNGAKLLSVPLVSEAVRAAVIAPLLTRVLTHLLAWVAVE